MSLILATNRSNVKDTTYYLTDFGSLEGFYRYASDPKLGLGGEFNEHEDKQLNGSFIRTGDFSKLISTDPVTVKREDEFIRTTSLLILDIDSHQRPAMPAPHLSSVHAVLCRMNINHFGYTTYKQTDLVNRCRVIIPCVCTSKEQLILTTHEVFEKIRAQGLPIATSSESKTMSQAWYFPVVQPKYQEYYAHYGFFEGIDYQPVSVGLSQESTQTYLPAAPEAPVATESTNGYRSIESIIHTLETGGLGIHTAIRDYLYGACRDGMTKKHAIAEVKSKLAHWTPTSNLDQARKKERLGSVVRIANATWAKFAIKGGPRPLPDLTVKDTVLERSVFPAWFLDAMEEISSVTQTPIESAAFCALSVLSTSLGRKVKLHEYTGGYHHSSLAFVLIARSGARKSPVFKICKEGLTRAQSFLQERSKEYAGESVLKITILKKRCTQLQSQLAKLHNPQDDEELYNEAVATEMRLKDIEESKKKFRTRIYGDDVTDEKFSDLMANNGNEFALLTAEGGPALANWSGQYSNGKAKDGAILKATTNDDIIVDRISESRDAIEIKNACGNVCIFVQPGRYYRMIDHEDLHDSGLLARLNPIFLKDLIGTRFKSGKEREINSVLVKPFHDLIEYFAVSSRETFLVNVRHSVESKRLWVKYSNYIEPLMARGGKLEKYTEIVNKNVTLAFKLGVLLEALKQRQGFLELSETTLSGESMAGGILLATSILNGMIEVDAHKHDNAIIEGAKELMEHFEGSVNFKKYVESGFAGSVNSSVGAKYKIDLAEKLELLEQYGWLYYNESGRVQLIDRRAPYRENADAE